MLDLAEWIRPLPRQHPFPDFENGAQADLWFCTGPISIRRLDPRIHCARIRGHPSSQGCERLRHQAAPGLLLARRWVSASIGSLPPPAALPAGNRLMAKLGVLGLRLDDKVRIEVRDPAAPCAACRIAGRSMPGAGAESKQAVYGGMRFGFKDESDPAEVNSTKVYTYPSGW